ncbi:helix-turn-helix domain-containing protein [Xanthobacter sp. V3C-3]|uniref:helix-turn-helix transcriptional regulator n=1 Tax=Xanthobacter lutulentifluminis TaxID=3119935 RepID=UPI00372B7A35
MTAPAKKLLTIRETMSILSVSRGTIYRLLGDGKIRARKIGKCVRIEVSEIDRLMANTPIAEIAPRTS